MDRDETNAAIPSFFGAVVFDMFSSDVADIVGWREYGRT
jgi:hypothetical protein